MQQPEKLNYTSFDNDQFDYLKWTNTDKPQKIIIAVHGINGAAQDYDNLASYLIGNSESFTIYALETRGQGNDHNQKRRGDIYRKEEWFKDLHTFTHMIRAAHPVAEITWCGESMGSLIITHACKVNKKSQPDRIILLAPVVSLRPHLSVLKHKLANALSYMFPRLRVSLNHFSGDQAIKVTQGGDNHDDQASTNSYFIDKFTLRLLATLGDLISEMHTAVQEVNCPVMLLNGGLDYLTPSESVKHFFNQIPQPKLNKHAYYPDSYHLLMYDNHRNQVFSDIHEWIHKQ